jgi:hypothetical protein
MQQETNGEEQKQMGLYEGLVKTSYNQLIFYKNDGREPTQHLLNDIEGYEKVLESEFPDDNALNFFKAKRGGLYKEAKFSDNLEIVNKLKEDGYWK